MISLLLLFTLSTQTLGSVLSHYAYHLNSEPSFPVLARQQTTRGDNSSSTNSTDDDSSGRRPRRTDCEIFANRFLSNGTFCSTISQVDPNTTHHVPITCPTRPQGGICLPLSACFLPAGLNSPPHSIQLLLSAPASPPEPANNTNSSSSSNPAKSAPSGDCSSQISILTVLAVINIVEAASNLIQGHDRVRGRLARFRDVVPGYFRSAAGSSSSSTARGTLNRESWTPVAGTISALTTFFFQVLLPAIGSWAENKDRGFSFGGLLGMWVLRPRGAFPMFILVRLVGWAGFKATLFDAIVTESLLDLVALPWALTFVLTNRAGDSDGPKGCGVEGYERPSDSQDMRLALAYASFGWATAAGVMSSLVLAQFVIMSFNKGESLTPEELKEKDEREKEEEEERGRRGWFWRRMVVREKRTIVPVVVAMGTFIGNWVLWGQFTSLQGNNYCEGAGGVATLAISIVHQILIPLLRACFGVAPDQPGKRVDDESE
ncbi:hypothetical protein V8F33_004693 [Rhypophila sp. PSN 637]